MTWAEFLKLWRATIKKAQIDGWPSVTKMTAFLLAQAKERKIGPI